MKLSSFLGLLPILAFLALLACSSTHHPPPPPPTAPPPAGGHPPDIAGWTPLPVENLTVVHQDPGLAVKVKTTTNTGGWTVELLPWHYEKPPGVWAFELVGKPPVGGADQVLTMHEVIRPVTLESATKWIQVNGANGPFRFLVPAARSEGK